MANKYRPRRASARWLDGDCPADVLCLLDSGPKTFDRFTVYYRHVYDVDSRPYLFGRGMSENPFHPQGFGQSIELEAHHVAADRYRTKSIRWSDLPPRVQECIRQDCQPGGLGSLEDEPEAA